jgi:undecaprenyl diphosphate synthase
MLVRGENKIGLIHIACIMDGNGRWATRRGLTRTDGHAAGEQAILATVDAALALRIPWLTLFAFSTENWRRSSAEIDFIMRFNQQIISSHGDDFHARGIRIRYMGMPDDRIPEKLSMAMRDIETVTHGNTRLTLTLAFNYGGRSEIVELVRRVVQTCTQPELLTEQDIRGCFQYPDMPDIDLLVRTAGEQRLSNFMLWHLAYAELVFMDTPWPDFKAEDLVRAVNTFRVRKRTFGCA